jgi:hypothetical protein
MQIRAAHQPAFSRFRISDTGFNRWCGQCESAPPINRPSAGFASQTPVSTGGLGNANPRRPSNRPSAGFASQTPVSTGGLGNANPRRPSTGLQPVSHLRRRFQPVVWVALIDRRHDYRFCIWRVFTYEYRHNSTLSLRFLHSEGLTNAHPAW